MSEQPDPYAGETRAERRRRRLAAEAARAEAARAQALQAGVDPGDLGRTRSADARPVDPPSEAAAQRPPLPRPSLRRPSNLGRPVGDPPPVEPSQDAPTQGNPPDVGPLDPLGVGHSERPAPPTSSGSSGSPTGDASDGTYSPRSARRKQPVAPLADLAAAQDPAAAAAALQLLAAQAAAARLRSPAEETLTGRASGPRARAGSPRGVPGPAASGRSPAPSRTPTADALAAARVAAARAAAIQQAQADPLRRRAITVGSTTPEGGAPGAPGTGAPSPPGRGAPTPPGRGAPSPPATDTRAARRRAGRPGRSGRADSWRTRAWAAAALLVIGGGTAFSIPHIGSLLADDPAAGPGPAPTSAASPEPEAQATALPSASGTAAAVTPACSGQTIAGALKPGDAAAAVFGAQTVGDAYCYVAGVLRDHSFTDLAVRRPAERPYTAADFAPLRAYLSADLAVTYDKDVAGLVASQDLATDEGRRLSALTRLAWDNAQLRFDPSASAAASKFEAGPPVTWTAKGADDVDRMGLGFETGVVTHMVDAAGRPAPHVLKRTYKLALVKGDATRPWLIDAYEVGESTAALVTVTPGAATPTAAATSPAATGR